MSLKRKQWMEAASPASAPSPSGSSKTSPTKPSTPGYGNRGGDGDVKSDGTPGRDKKKVKMETPALQPGAPTVAFGEFASFGRNIYTRAIIIRDTLRKRRGPINIPDLEWNLRVADPEIRISEELLEAVKQHEGIIHNAALNTIEYKPPYDWTTPQELLTYIKTHSSQPGGIPVARIRTEYSGPEHPNTLLTGWENEGHILIMRVPGNMSLPDPGAKLRRNAVMKGAELNAAPMMEVPNGKNWRAVHWDSVRERGDAPPGKIDEEFREMWADVKTPVEADLPKLLAALGHKVDPRETAKKTAVKGPSKKKKRTGARNVSKLTNVHLLEKGIDLSKDYVPE
ncbi:hypothetical protein NliqN6_5843 [Naganishia liquefaciens]|uniref:Transcription initiation factor IIE subunit beta E-tether domain-containing protein n=1 Tax=Naganishia liquefaciens TaxID=104408 RepID=A0A8H3YJE0_9TREE|nr:hypothetical protein NliqN6_5843 [Naganishia liquefaciens]